MRNPITSKENNTIRDSSKDQDETENFLIRSFVWVFRSPDGRHTQTDLDTLHHSSMWDDCLSIVVLGRIAFRVNQWLKR